MIEVLVCGYFDGCLKKENMDMMKLHKKTLVAAVVLAIASGSVMAGTAAKGKNTGATAKEADGNDNRAVAQLAIQLAQYGDRNKDALALIAAAKMQVQVGMRAKVVEKEAAKGEDAKADTSKPALDPSTKGLLERAKQYAGDRKDLIALADDVAAAGSRGRIEGPFVGETVVRARSRDKIPVTFAARELARVAISGDGDSDLDLSVTDENGNEVCSSTRSGDDEYCDFTPRWTGQFYVRVTNYGQVANRYQILFN